MDTIKTTAQLFSGYEVKVLKSRKTERGEYIKYFSERMNMTMSRMGMLLSIYKDDDQLYWLKLKCENAKIFGQCFNWHLFPKSI